MMRQSGRLALLSAALFVVTGCGGTGTTSYGNATATPNPNSAAGSGLITQSAGLLPFPAVNGFSGIISVPSAASGAGAQASIVVQTTAPSGLPTLTNAVVFAS